MSLAGKKTEYKTHWELSSVFIKFIVDLNFDSFYFVFKQHREVFKMKDSIRDFYSHGDVAKTMFVHGDSGHLHRAAVAVSVIAVAVLGAGLFVWLNGSPEVVDDLLNGVKELSPITNHMLEVSATLVSIGTIGILVPVTFLVFRGIMIGNNPDSIFEGMETNEEMLNRLLDCMDTSPDYSWNLQTWGTEGEAKLDSLLIREQIPEGSSLVNRLSKFCGHMQDSVIKNYPKYQTAGGVFAIHFGNKVFSFAISLAGELQDYDVTEAAKGAAFYNVRIVENQNEIEIRAASV